MYPVNLPLTNGINKDILYDGSRDHDILIQVHGYKPKYHTVQEYFEQVMEPQGWGKYWKVYSITINSEVDIEINCKSFIPTLSIEFDCNCLGSNFLDLPIPPESIKLQQQAYDYSLALKAISELQKQGK